MSIVKWPLFSVGEEIRSSDLQLVIDTVRTMVFDSWGALMHVTEDGGVAPASFLFCIANGCAMEPGIALTVNTLAGWIFQPSGSAVTGDAPTIAAYYAATNEFQTLHAVGHATLDRYDLVCVKLDETDGPTATRSFKDATTGALTSQTPVVTRVARAQKSLVVGTPNASPVEPAVPSGYVKLYAVRILATQTGVIQPTDLYDYRMPAGLTVCDMYAADIPYLPGPDVNSTVRHICANQLTFSPGYNTNTPPTVIDWYASVEGIQAFHNTPGNLNLGLDLKNGVPVSISITFRIHNVIGSMQFNLEAVGSFTLTVPQLTSAAVTTEQTLTFNTFTPSAAKGYVININVPATGGTSVLYEVSTVSITEMPSGSVRDWIAQDQFSLASQGSSPSTPLNMIPRSLPVATAGRIVAIGMTHKCSVPTTTAALVPFVLNGATGVENAAGANLQSGNGGNNTRPLPSRSLTADILSTGDATFHYHQVDLTAEAWWTDGNRAGYACRPRGAFPWNGAAGVTRLLRAGVRVTPGGSSPQDTIGLLRVVVAGGL